MSVHYLDHAATTAVPESVAHAYAADLVALGNPSSTHAAGRAARRALEEAREALAADLGAHPTEVLFTSGGTEADNLGMVGAWQARTAAAPQVRGVVIGATEHHAVLESAHALSAERAAQVVVAEVDRDGIVTPERLAALLGAHPQTAVAGIMWANNESGAINPIGALAQVCAERGVPLHTDAVQAVGHVPVDFAASGVSTLALSGHKMGAPVGVGALLARRDAPLTPVVHGGGQERGVRSGTLNVAGARALAAAVRMCVEDLAAEHDRCAALRDRLAAGVLAAVPDAAVTAAHAPRLPGHLLVTIPGTDSDALLFGLDAAGIAASAGSACQAGVTQPSHVLLAMGADDATARSALRFTLGRTSTGADVDAALAALPDVVERARAASSTSHRRRPQGAAR